MFRDNQMLRRIATGSGVAVLLFLVLGFSNRLAEYTRLNAQLAQENARMTELVATEAHLLDEIAYATSQAAVEQWAREEARMALPGDFAVIPLPPAGSTPQAAANPTPTAQPLSKWEAWLNWFFYDGP